MKTDEHLNPDKSVRKNWYGSGEQPWDVAKRLGWAPAFAATNVLKYLRRTKDPEHSLESARWYYAELTKMALANPTASYKTPLGFASVIKERLVAELTDEEFTKISPTEGGRLDP